jgi:hypothetical protein
MPRLHPLSRSPQSRFADVAAAACASYGELLGALERELCSVNRDGLDEALDDIALPLFGVDRAPLEDRAIALGRAAWAALPDEACSRRRGCSALRLRKAVVPRRFVRRWRLNWRGEPAWPPTPRACAAAGRSTCRESLWGLR